MKNALIAITEWMDNLQPLPDFLKKAESLAELRSRIETHLSDVQNTTSNAGGLLEQVRDTVSGY